MALTKVTGQVVSNTTDVTVGVLTVSGISTFTGRVAIGTDLRVEGSVSVGGTVTYEDVTNVNSIGDITVGSGITLSKDGDIFFTGIMTGNGSGLTGVANTDVIFPDKISFSDSAAGSINLGIGSDLQLYHDSNHSYIKNATNDLLIQNTGDDVYIDAADDIFIRTSNNEDAVKCIGDGAVELYHNGLKKLETASGGVTVTGNIVGTSFTASGPTGQTAFVNQHAVGVGSTTTTGKFAGVGTDAGTIVFDVTKSTLEFYNGNLWVPTSSTVPSITSISGNIIASNASTITLAGGGFGAANLVVKFVQSSDSIDTSTTVTPTSSSAASVAVPAAVYNNVTAGNAVTITVTNSDGLESAGATKDAIALPSGGTVTTSGNYRIHTFTSSGTFVNTIASLSVEYLVIAGGGAGGVGDANANAYGGGGGAGGYRTNVAGQTSGGGASAESALTISAGNKTVTVGAGGAGASGDNQLGTNGGDSVFDSITSIGGGRGGANSADGSSGGSGGGGKESDGSGQSGTSGQGYGGGPGSEGGNRGGGGGGAGGSGGTSSGGGGVSSTITGSAVTRAGGGGSNGSGGSGGGGDGGDPTGYNGTANTGSGGGAATEHSGNGGSGLVVVRYLTNNL